MTVEVPQWLQDIVEYEATMWELGRMRDALAVRSPLDAAIDKATGYEAQLATDAEQLMRRASELRTRLDESGGQHG